MQVDDTADTGLEVALNAVGRALKAGQLDEAADKLSPISSRGEREGRLNQALAGKFLQAERFEDAIPFAQHAWLCEPENTDRAKLFAWALAKAGLLDASVKVLRWTVARAPDRIELKKDLLTRLMQAAQFDEAGSIAAEISQAEPDNPDHIFVQANILRQAERYNDAVALLRAWIESDKATENDWQRLLSYLLSHGTPAEAAELAAQMANRWPHSVEAHKRAYNLLARAGKSKDAVQFARVAVEMNPSDASAHRALSALLTDIRYFSEAFQHALHAANIEPGNASYRIFLAHHYRRMGQLSDALAELSVALMIDPNNRKALIDFIELLKMRGQWAQVALAQRRGQELHPDDPAFFERGEADEETQITNSAPQSIDDSHDFFRAKSEARIRRTEAKSTLFDRSLRAIATHVRVTWALMLREVQTRYGKTELGFAWAFLEPVIHLGMLGVSMAMFRGNRAPLGHYYIVFHFTAIIPYLTFVHAAGHLSLTRRQVALLQMPMVHLNDIFFAKGILEFLVSMVVAVGLLAGFCLAGYQYMPVDPLEMLNAWFWVWLLGCGIGMINCMICTKFEAWDMVWHNIARALYFISGLFYLPEYLPQEYLQYLIWNPLLHGIDWSRSAFYNNYHPYLLSKGYLVSCAIVSVLIGLALERIMRKEALVYQ